MIQTAVCIGDLAYERTTLLALIPQDAVSGGFVRGMHFLVGEDLDQDPSNYWLAQIGFLDASGAFQTVREVALTQRLPANVARLEGFLDPLAVPRGSRLALRMSPRGDAPPIVGLSVIPEWGTLGTSSPVSRR